MRDAIRTHDRGLHRYIPIGKGNFAETPPSTTMV